MREIRSYGSVRGVVGNRYPYRDSPNSILWYRSNHSAISILANSDAQHINPIAVVMKPDTPLSNP